MFRVHFVTPCLAAAVCLAFWLPTRTGAAARPWNPAEQDAPLFNQEARYLDRPLASRSVSPTLAKWKHAAHPRPRARSLVLGKEPLGVRLASYQTASSVFSFCAGPDNIGPPQPIFFSVQNGGNGPTCSTMNGQASDICSVKSPVIGFCSTLKAGACSTGANGSPGTPYPGQCSVTLSAAGSKCSAQESGFCSTSPAPNNGPGTTCSVFGGGSGQSCSTGVNAGGAAQQGGNCSVLFPGSSASTCSALSSGQAGAGNQNSCSADANGGAQNTCSVSGLSQAGDFCSVAQGTTNVQCTVQAGPTGFCSVIGAGQGSCSIQGGAGPVKGLCSQ